MKNNHLLTKVVSLFSVLTILFSCSKTDMVGIDLAVIDNTIDQQTALRNFSIALSKVVYQNQPVRELIKKEALGKFDNDYDVLYPLIKDRIIADGKTVHTLLAEALGDEVQLNNIEAIIPTLTIFVTNVTWFDPEGFCAEKWNTEDERVSVTYKQTNGNCSELFANGYDLGTIEAGVIPGGPVLIVKTNERVVVNPSTKGGTDVDFTFIDDVFDGSKKAIETKDIRYTGEYSVSWISGQPAEDHSDIISASALNSLNPDIITAYNLFNGNPYACQNDYVYYGMTSNAVSSPLRNDVRNKLVRFKISPNSFNSIFNDPTDGDMDFEDVYDTDDNGFGPGVEPSVEEIYSRLWADGALEINVKVYAANETGNGYLAGNFFYDVKASDLFTLKNYSIKKEQWWSTIFKWYITWKYTITARDASTLTEKWYYPTNTPDLPIWDLKKNSSYYIVVTEHDSGSTITTSETVTTRRANSVTSKVGVEYHVNEYVTMKNEMGWTTTDEETNSTTVTVSKTYNDDSLISQTVSYADNYITGAASSSSYYVHSYGSDRFTFTILPCRY